jgi:hypothetical protein
VTPLADGTPCESADPCYLDGQCGDGQCDSEENAGSSCPKSRFISFDTGDGITDSRAFRVRLVSLHHPDPPYTGGVAADFTAFEGEYRWVGTPGTYTESQFDPTIIMMSVLTCQPVYLDWSPIGLLHVTGPEIVPVRCMRFMDRARNDINQEDSYLDHGYDRDGVTSHSYNRQFTTARLWDVRNCSHSMACGYLKTPRPARWFRCGREHQSCPAVEFQ